MESKTSLLIRQKNFKRLQKYLIRFYGLFRPILSFQIGLITSNRAIETQSFLIQNINLTQVRLFTIHYKFRIPEWYAGMRKNAFFIILLNIIAIIFYNQLSVQVVIVLVASIILMSFFSASKQTVFKLSICLPE